uniref:Uncharacterized protein n=1 Tax=Ditylenchus dipsaci TaxID=166011 RepID=A0A915CQH8_9BILA
MSTITDNSTVKCELQSGVVYSLSVAWQMYLQIGTIAADLFTVAGNVASGSVPFSMLPFCMTPPGVAGSEHADGIADVLQSTPDTNRSRRIGCRLIKIHRWHLPSTCHP